MILNFNYDLFRHRMSEYKDIMRKNVKIITNNVEETWELAKKLANDILKISSDKATVIGLEGNLGTGKTMFAQGFARGLGVKETIVSPTFIIMKKFQISKSKCQIKSQIPISNFKKFIHIDAYRLDNSKEIMDLGWNGLIADPKNIILVEWADKIREILPKNFIWVKFKVVGEEKREIVVNVKCKSQNAK